MRVDLPDPEPPVTRNPFRGTSTSWWPSRVPQLQTWIRDSRIWPGCSGVPSRGSGSVIARLVVVVVKFFGGAVATHVAVAVAVVVDQ